MIVFGKKARTIEIFVLMISIKTDVEKVTNRLQSARLAKGGAVAEKSFAILVLVGIAEVSIGIFSLSLALIADGVQSFADAVVSLIVRIGLRFSGKAPDGRFARAKTLKQTVEATRESSKQNRYNLIKEKVSLAGQNIKFDISKRA